MSEESIKSRMFDNVYICLKCNARNKAKQKKVEQGKVKCRKCGSKSLRPKSTEDRS